MKQLKAIYADINKHGTAQHSRCGDVIALNGVSARFNLYREGFPAVTSKKLNINGVIGELLFFLSGKQDLATLRHYTFGENAKKDSFTIWDADAKRAGTPDTLNHMYPEHWRNFAGQVDQIQYIIDLLKKDPTSRKAILTNVNPTMRDKWTLDPCHLGATFSIDIINDVKWLDCSFYCRSQDSFLGTPYNIASYAALTHIIAKLIGAKPRNLIYFSHNSHIYTEHFEAVNEYMSNPMHRLPRLKMPPFKDLDDLLQNYTSLDFSLVGYFHEGYIKSPVLVGDEELDKKSIEDYKQWLAKREGSNNE